MASRRVNHQHFPPFMQFHVESADSKATTLLQGLLAIAETFLNEHLGGNYYGTGLRHIALALRERFPGGRSPQTMWRYQGTSAERLVAELESEDARLEELSAERLRGFITTRFRSVLATREMWHGAFDSPGLDDSAPLKKLDDKHHECDNEENVDQVACDPESESQRPHH